MRSLLGGKGAGLAEMLSLGIPVTDGFTVTTEACIAASRANGVWPDGLADEIDEALEAFEQRVGLGLGDPQAPLLVSVRSGAVVSMPGMMDTILNLGLNDETVLGLAKASGNRRFALDSYRRLLQMFGNVVEGVESHLFEDVLARAKRERSVQNDVDLDEDALAGVVRDFQRVYLEGAGHPFPQDPREQLRLAISAVFGSWDSPRATGLPACERHLRLARHRRQHLPDGLRQPRRHVGHRRLLLARPLDGRARAVRRVPAQRPGRGRRRRHPHARADRAHGRAAPAGLRPARRDGRAARAALRRHAGRRVHGRARLALPAADALGQAHRPRLRSGSPASSRARA